jgi:hypothetical protein
MHRSLHALSVGLANSNPIFIAKINAAPKSPIEPPWIDVADFGDVDVNGPNPMGVHRHDALRVLVH